MISERLESKGKSVEADRLKKGVNYIIPFFLPANIKSISGHWAWSMNRQAPSCRHRFPESIVKLLECIENADTTGKKI